MPLFNTCLRVATLVVVVVASLFALALLSQIAATYEMCCPGMYEEPEGGPDYPPREPEDMLQGRLNETPDDSV